MCRGTFGSWCLFDDFVTLPFLAPWLLGSVVIRLLLVEYEKCKTPGSQEAKKPKNGGAIMIDDGPDMVNDLPEPDPHLDTLIKRVLDACFLIHSKLRPGLPESNYEAAMCIEFRKREIPFVRQPIVEVRYDDEMIGECRLDFIVDHKLVLEIKAVEKIEEVHKVQLLTYLKITKNRIGLLINWNVNLLKHGIKRIINPYLHS